MYNLTSGSTKKIMNRLLLALVAAVILAIAWAALHDIVKQKEANYVAEWAMLAASVVFFGYLTWKELRARRVNP